MTPTTPLSTIILAAGKGTRMKSDKAKVLHELFFAPMIHHVLHALTPLKAAKNMMVVGHQRQKVMEALQTFSVDYVVQEEQLGTGHAVLCCEGALKNAKGTIMILCGDTPLIQTATLQAMHEHHVTTDATITVMTTVLEQPTNYGRIITGKDKNVIAIVEEKDASPEEKNIKEINAGIYCVDADFLFEALKGVGTDNSQGEVYLTDIVSIAVGKGQKVHKYTNPFPHDVLGVNSRVELAKAHNELQLRNNESIMLSGSTMYNPETILIDPAVNIGQDTVLHQGVNITGKSRIGRNVTLEQGVILRDCILEDNTTVGAYSYLDNCTVPAKNTISPYSCLIDKKTNSEVI